LLFGMGIPLGEVEAGNGNPIDELQSLCHDSSVLNQYVGAGELARFDNICSAAGIYFSRHDWLDGVGEGYCWRSMGSFCVSPRLS
jgi:hypothetical protein